MSKEDSIEVTGTVVEKFPSGLFSVQLDQERTVFFDDLIPVAGAGTDKPPRAEIRAVLFVIDAVNTRPGTSGRLWITNPALQR